MMRIASEEIARKKALVQELMAKYPDLKISAEAIIKYEASEVERLVQLLLFDERISKAVEKIQRAYKMRCERRRFLGYLRRRIRAKEVIWNAWKRY